MQGRDLSVFLARSYGEKVNWRSDFFYEHLFRHPRIPMCEGVVGQRYKYMSYFQNEHVFEELFDLNKDPLEMDNLAGKAKFASLLDEMKERKRDLSGSSR